MDSQRNLLIIALLFVSFMIWQAREQDKIRSPSSRPRRLRPQQRVAPPTGRTGQWRKLITVKTDVLELTINTNGGDIEQALLLAYPKR